ncbi:MAG: hypothetical protein LBD03_08525 [Methanobrevibacter sp.]|jgi:hypothetical protein|nr:hypothetical protein [Candidatus Methanovirga procula]
MLLLVVFSVVSIDSANSIAPRDDGARDDGVFSNLRDISVKSSGTFYIKREVNKDCTVWLDDENHNNFAQHHFTNGAEWYVTINGYYYIVLNEDGKWGQNLVYGPFSDKGPFANKFIDLMVTAV